MKNTFSNMSAHELQEIAGRISYLRQDRLTLSQEQFANTLNISQTYLSLIESGKKPVSENLVRQICSVYHVDISWLLYGLGDGSHVFAADSDAHDKLFADTKTQAMKYLKLAYSLKTTDTEFLAWYLSLAPANRAVLARSVRELRQLPG